MSVPDGGNERKDISLQKSLSNSCVGLKARKQRPLPRMSRSVVRREAVSTKQKREGKSLSKKIGLRGDGDMSASKAIGLKNGARDGRQLSKEEQEFEAYRKFRDSQLKRKSRDRSKSPRRKRNYLGLRPSQKELREKRARYVSA